MGTKTKVERKKTKFKPLPLGRPAFAGRQKEIFGQLGDIFSKRLRDPLTSPGFAAGRDFLSRRTEDLQRRVRGAPNLLAGLRFGAERDIESAETGAISDLIGQILLGTTQQAQQFAFRPIQRGAVGATSGEISRPGVTAGEQFGRIGLQSLEAFGTSLGQRLGGGFGGGGGGKLPQGVFA